MVNDHALQLKPFLKAIQRYSEFGKTIRVSLREGRIPTGTQFCTKLLSLR